MTTPEPTHTVPHLGQRIPVDIVGPSTLGGRPAVRVEAAAGEPFQRYTHGGWVSDSRADFPPELVRAIEPALPDDEYDMTDAEVDELAAEWGHIVTYRERELNERLDREDDEREQREYERDQEADIELRFGGLLQDPDAPAEAVNAAMREWREVKGYAEAEVG